jgi:outer membrane lipoprotein-sorting protein
MRIELLALLLAAAVQENEGEKLFRKVDQQIVGAKTLRISFEMTHEEGGMGFNLTGFKLKGTMLLAPGNKIRFEGTGENHGQEGKVKIIMVSDGTKLRTLSDGRPADEDTPKHLTELMKISLLRVGFLGPTLFLQKMREKDFRTDDLFQLSDFKLKKNEALGSRQARVIEYQLRIPPNKDMPATVTVWLDAKNNMPLKHTAISESPGRRPVRYLQTLSEIVIDPKIDPKQFELPK